MTMTYQPRNATESYMLVEIESLKKTNVLLKDSIDIKEDEIQRLNNLVNFYKKHAKDLENEYKDRWFWWETACYESDVRGMELEEENRELKKKIEELENKVKQVISDNKNAECEYWFLNEECGYWKRCYKNLLKDIRDLVSKEKIWF